MTAPRWSALAAALTATALLACTEDSPSGPPTPVSYTLSPTRQWSGGTVLLKAPGIHDAPGYHLVVAGEDSLTPVPVNDSTVSFTLPMGPSGSITIRVSGAAGGDSVGSVERVGYTGSRELSEMYWGMRPWRPTGTFAVLGLLQNGNVASIDLESGALTEYPSLTYASDNQYEIYPTDSASQFVLQDRTNGRNGIWKLAPVAIQVDTVPWVATSVPRQAYKLSDDVWLRTGSHESQTLTVSDTTIVWDAWGESPWDIYRSADGRFSTLAANVFLAGIPVFDNSTGDSLYTLSLVHVKSAVFSADSRVLFALGGAEYNLNDSLLAVDAATGVRLRGAQLPDSAAGYSVTVDAAGEYLYVDAQFGALLSVLVYDASTLTLAGRLETGWSCPPRTASGCDNSAVLLVDPAGHRLFDTRPGGPAIVHTFDLLP